MKTIKINIFYFLGLILLVSSYSQLLDSVLPIVKCHYSELDSNRNLPDYPNAEDNDASTSSEMFEADDQIEYTLMETFFPCSEKFQILFSAKLYNLTVIDRAQHGIDQNVPPPEYI